MTYDAFGQYIPNLLLILSIFTVGVASPGPATLMIAGTAMSQGRMAALALSFGIITGSMFWAVIAASGFVAALAASAIIFSVLKVLGGLYLLYLAVRSLRSALKGSNPIQPQSHSRADVKTNYLKGMLLHLTNPKAPLVWMATLSIGLGDDAPISFLMMAIGACSIVAVGIFVGYAVLFSTPVAARAYTKSRRPFETVMAILFGAAALRILTTRGS